MQKTRPLTRLKSFFATQRGALFGLWAAYFLYWASLAPFIPYLSLFYESVGLTGAQIGQLGFIRSIVSFFSALTIAFLSDVFRRRKRILTACVFGMIALLLVFPRMASFATLLPVVALYSVFLAPTISILDEDTLRTLDNPRDYGMVRMGGSIGWGILVFAGGAILDIPGVPLTAMFWIHIFFLGLMLPLIALLPESNAKLADGEKASLKDVGRLLRHPGFMVWLGVLFVSGLTSSSIINFIALHIKGLGGSATLVGLAMAVNVMGEIVGLAIAKRLQGRVGSRRMMVLCFLLRGFWFVGLGLVPSAWWILPVHAVGGFSYALIQAGSVAYVNERAPRRIGTTAQAVRGAVLIRLSTAAGALFSGALFEGVGSARMYVIMGLISWATFVLALAFRSYERRREAAQKAA